MADLEINSHIIPSQNKTEYKSTCQDLSFCLSNSPTNVIMEIGKIGKWKMLFYKINYRAGFN